MYLRVAVCESLHALFGCQLLVNWEEQQSWHKRLGGHLEHPVQLTPSSLRSPEQLELVGNPNIAQIQCACAGVGVNGVGDLIVLALAETSKIDQSSIARE